MPTPTIAQEYATTEDTDQEAVSVAVSGFNTGDLLLLFISTDGDVSGSYATTGVTGMTQEYLGTDNQFMAMACYTKTLVSGDTSATDIGVSWTGAGGQKSVLYVARIASGDHSGIVGTAAATYNGTDNTPDIPAMADLPEDDNLVFAHMGCDGDITVVSNPSGYTTVDFDTNAIASGVSQWVGTDGLSGAQLANTMEISNTYRNCTGIVAVGPGSGGGGTINKGCISLGIKLGL